MSSIMPAGPHASTATLADALCTNSEITVPMSGRVYDTGKEAAGSAEKAVFSSSSLLLMLLLMLWMGDGDAAVIATVGAFLASAKVGNAVLDLLP